MEQPPDNHAYDQGYFRDLIEGEGFPNIVNQYLNRLLGDFFQGETSHLLRPMQGKGHQTVWVDFIASDFAKVFTFEQKLKTGHGTYADSSLPSWYEPISIYKNVNKEFHEVLISLRNLMGCRSLYRNHGLGLPADQTILHLDNLMQKRSTLGNRMGQLKIDKKRNRPYNPEYQRLKRLLAKLSLIFESLALDLVSLDKVKLSFLKQKAEREVAFLELGINDLLEFINPHSVGNFESLPGWSYYKSTILLILQKNDFNLAEFLFTIRSFKPFLDFDSSETDKLLENFLLCLEK